MRAGEIGSGGMSAWLRQSTMCVSKGVERGETSTRNMKKQELDIRTGRDGELDIKKGMIGTRKQRMKQKQGTERIELG